MKRQEEAVCKGVVLDTNSCVNFQSYLQQLGWRQGRCGVLYGTYDDESKVTVDFIYEPDQVGDETGARAYDYDDDDDDEEDDDDAMTAKDQEKSSKEEREKRRAEAAVVDSIAEVMGLRKVGFIFAHPPREKNFVFSGSEAIRAATLQLHDADGVEKTPFVTVKVTVNEEGESQFEAYQVSLQCMAMVAEGALGVTDDDLASCAIHPSFTAVVEGKGAPSVDTNFFLCNVPVTQRQSDIFTHASFPKEHRLVPQTRDDLKRRIQASPNLIANLADFSLLLFLANFPQIFDHDSFLPALCYAIKQQQQANIPLDDGYRLILYSFAGLDI